MVISWCSCILDAITSSSELIGIGDDFILFLTRIATPPLARFGFVCLSLKYHGSSSQLHCGYVLNLFLGDI